MNNRRKFLAAGGALAALSAVPKATADPPRMNGLYIHGMVWNRQLAAPMNDWLIRLDAKVEVPIGNAPPPAVPGFATLGDDFHDPVGSHVAIHEATLKGDQLTINGAITESKMPALVRSSLSSSRSRTCLQCFARTGLRRGRHGGQSYTRFDLGRRHTAVAQTFGAGDRT